MCVASDDYILPSGVDLCAPNITGLLLKEAGMQKPREEVKKKNLKKGGEAGEKKKGKLSEEHSGLAATSKAPLPQDIKRL